MKAAPWFLDPKQSEVSQAWRAKHSEWRVLRETQPTVQEWRARLPGYGIAAALARVRFYL